MLSTELSTDIVGNAQIRFKNEGLAQIHGGYSAMTDINSMKISPSAEQISMRPRHTRFFQPVGFRRSLPSRKVIGDGLRRETSKTLGEADKTAVLCRYAGVL
jgi:hypothetical protein